MRDRRDIRSSLRSIGDSYVHRNPADYAKVRSDLESRRKRRFIRSFSLSVAAIGTVVLVAVAVVSLPAERDERVVASNTTLITATLDLDAAPESVHAKSDGAWASVDGNRLLGLDAETSSVLWATDLPGDPADVLPGAGEVWVTVPDQDLVVAFDSESGEETRRFSLSLGSTPTRLTVGAVALRVVVDGDVLRIDLGSGDMTTLYESGDAVEIAMGSHAFWILTESGRIVGIDPDTGASVEGLSGSRVQPGGEITYARGELWYGREGDPLLQVIDESSGGDPAGIELPGGYVDLDAGGPGAWVLVSTGEATGRLLDLVPGQAVLGARTVDLDGGPVDISIASGGGGIWAALAQSGEAVRIEP